MRIVYKDNFKNFFQMTMHFLACVETILRKLYFTRNYIFTLNISAEQLLPQCNQFNITVTFSRSYFFRTATFYLPSEPTFSEHSLLLSSYFFKIATYSGRNIYRPATSCEKVVIQGSQFFRTATLQKDKFVQNINIQKSFFFEGGTSKKHQIFFNEKMIISK